MDPKEFFSYILNPALDSVSLNSKEAAVLMLGTALQESQLQHLKQSGGGPGLGIYQIEQPTYDDINRYLSRFDNAKLKERCLSACFYSAWPPSDAVIHNLRWATIVARIKYEMISAAIPNAGNAEALAAYYIKYYNAGGKANLETSVLNFKHAISIIGV